MTTDYQMYFAGEWCAGASGKRAPATSPANGEQIGTLAEGGRGHRGGERRVGHRSTLSLMPSARCR